MAAAAAALRFAASKISSGRALERIGNSNGNGGMMNSLRRFSSESPSNLVANNVCTQCGAKSSSSSSAAAASMANNAAEPIIASSPHLGQPPSSVPWWSAHHPRFVPGVFLTTIGVAVGGGAIIYVEAKYTYEGPIFGNDPAASGRRQM